MFEKVQSQFGRQLLCQLKQTVVTRERREGRMVSSCLCLPDDVVALAAHGGAHASRDVLGPLHQGVEVLRMRLRGGAVWTFGRRVGNSAERRSRSTLWKTFKNQRGKIMGQGK